MSSSRLFKPSLLNKTKTNFTKVSFQCMRSVTSLLGVEETRRLPRLHGYSARNFQPQYLQNINFKRSFTTALSMDKPPTSNQPHLTMSNAKGSLIYTVTDEAPALATFSLLPILTKVSLSHQYVKSHSYCWSRSLCMYIHYSLSSFFNYSYH